LGAKVGETTCFSVHYRRAKTAEKRLFPQQSGLLGLSDSSSALHPRPMSHFSEKHSTGVARTRVTLGPAQTARFQGQCQKKQGKIRGRWNEDTPVTAPPSGQLHPWPNTQAEAVCKRLGKKDGVHR